MNRLKRILTPPLVVFAAILMWVEEWLWEHLKGLTAWIANFPLIHWLETLIVRLPPYPTMLVFLLPASVFLPVKIGALWLITHGQMLLGFGLIIGAKIIGTAMAARLYVVSKPKLMTIAWFAFLHNWLTATRDYLYSRVKAMPLYQAIRARLSAWKQRVRVISVSIRGSRGIGFRWRAIRRFLRLHRKAR